MGEVVAQLTSDSVDSQLTNATFSLQEAELSRDRLLKQLDDYTITAPIEGTVVKKNKKAGEKIESGGGGNSSASSSSNSNVLAVIYDMSSLCFQLDVDEMDVKKIAVGQEVIITADAVEGTTYNGVVENVSVNGTITPAQSQVEFGQDKEFTITPEIGYYISSIKIDGQDIVVTAFKGESQTYTFENVSANHTIEATFAIQTFTVTFVDYNNEILKKILFEEHITEYGIVDTDSLIYQNMP